MKPSAAGAEQSITLQECSMKMLLIVFREQLEEEIHGLLTELDAAATA
jgi:hypothetical protein